MQVKLLLLFYSLLLVSALNQECSSDSTCPEGYNCISSYCKACDLSGAESSGRCNGLACSADSECASSTCYNGLCSFCDETKGNFCNKQYCSEKFFSVLDPALCLSNTCKDKVCQGCFLNQSPLCNGQTCTLNEDCATSTCINQKCAICSNIDEGMMCGGHECDYSSDCASNTCLNEICSTCGKEIG
mmetsp:Transcript_3611/g.2665  ORF Transcript_3611/g.2665 Transcript_3611/m.2665 type:complete len:187 (+) Transcript_3611:17-577(+)